MKTRKASDFMTKTVVTAREDMILTDVMQTLLRHSIGCLPVVDEHQGLVGIITEYDIMNTAVSGEADRTRVGEAMHREVFTFTPDTDLETIVNTCLTKRIHRAPIMQDGKLVGIVSRRDIMREILAMYHRP